MLALTLSLIVVVSVAILASQGNTVKVSKDGARVEVEIKGEVFEVWYERFSTFDPPLQSVNVGHEPSGDQLQLYDANKDDKAVLYVNQEWHLVCSWVAETSDSVTIRLVPRQGEASMWKNTNSLL